MSEFSHALGADPTTGAIPQKTLDWLAENLPDGGTSGSLDAEAVQDVVAAMLTEGTGVTLNYDDGAGTLTITATAGGGSTDPEIVRDVIGSTLVAGTGVTVTVNDAANTITLAVSGLGISDVSGLQAALDGKASTTHTHDDRYYTEGEVDSALSGKANTTHSHGVTDLTATGTPSASTYLRGDGTWSTPEVGSDASGTVTSVNGVEPDETGNVEIESLGGVLAEIDPDDPTGRTLLFTLPSKPSVSLTVSTSGWTATATFAGASPEDLAMTYAVDWGDGTVTSPATSPATRTYDPVGASYTVTVTATDSAGGTATASRSINIDPPGLTPFGGQVYADNPSVFFPMNDVGPAIVDFMGNATASPGDFALPELVTRNLGAGDKSTEWDDTTGASLGEPAALEGMSHISVETIVQSSLGQKQGTFLWRRDVVGGFSVGPMLSWNGTTVLWGIGGAQGTVNVPHNAPLISDILHIVGTYDQQNLVLYINGVEVGRQAQTRAMHNAAGVPWLMGPPPTGGLAFYGWMGAFAIYDHVLTPARVAAHYAATGLGG